MKSTKRLTLAAILSALSVVILLLGSIITVLDLSTVALASIIIMVAVIELRGGFPYLIWLVSGILALLIVPDKFGALIYLIFGGIYPIIKSKIERLPRAVMWILKFASFNIMLTAALLVMRFIIVVPDMVFDFNIPLYASIYAVCNFTFLLYDIAMTQLITLYLVRLRGQLRLGRFFK